MFSIARILFCSWLKKKENHLSFFVADNFIEFSLTTTLNEAPPCASKRTPFFTSFTKQLRNGSFYGFESVKEKEKIVKYVAFNSFKQAFLRRLDIS